MTVALQKEGELIALVGPSLRVTFRRLDDRWTHEVEFGPGEQAPWLVLARAVEWMTASEDPAIVVSPVYQEIHAETDPLGPVLLAVGQAGPHHFSASVRMRILWRGPNTHDMFHCETQADFDVACRTRATLKSLSCHYDLDLRNAFRLGGIDAPRPSFCWETHATHDYNAAIRSCEAPACRIEQVSNGEQSERIRVVLVQPPAPGTSRIRYLWSHASVFPRAVAETLPYWKPPS